MRLAGVVKREDDEPVGDRFDRGGGGGEGQQDEDGEADHGCAKVKTYGIGLRFWLAK
jgi:hypothetical protein